MSEFADLLQLIAGWSVRCGQCPQRQPKPLLCLPPLQNISNFNFQQLHKGLQQPIRPLFYFFFALLLPFVSPLLFPPFVPSFGFPKRTKSWKRALGSLSLHVRINTMGNNTCNAKLKRLPGVPTVYPDVRPEQKVGISPRDGRRGGLAVTMYIQCNYLCSGWLTDMCALCSAATLNSNVVWFQESNRQFSCMSHKTTY